MAAAEHDLVVDQGETFIQVLTWADDAGTGIDLYGYEARMQVRRAYADDDTGEPFVDLTLGAGIVFTDEAAGEITITIGADVTEATPPGAWYYDLEVESGAGAVSKLLRGRFLIRGEVTR